MTRRRISCIVLAAAIAGAALPAGGQDKPYAEQMGQLAEILGSLHYLTGLCDQGTSPYRDQMTAVIEAEAPEAAFRAQLVDRFNLGYSSFAAVYRQCTPAAEEAIALYRADGAALAAAIATEYGAPAAPTAATIVTPAAPG